VIVTLTGNKGFTTMVTEFEVAGLPVEQSALDDRIQVTTSPCTGLYRKIELLVPLLTPFTFHWKPGLVPPLTGVAVNVTDVPEQTGFAEGAILMLTGMRGFTIIVTGSDCAGFPPGHMAFEVSMQIT
jgi:hypothetical protein